MNTLFDTDRLQMTDAIRMTAESLRAYGQRYPDWVIAWSVGGLTSRGEASRA